MTYDSALSHFDLDLGRGRQGEMFISDLADALARGAKTIEVKTDAYFFSASAERYKGQRLYVEMECLGRDGQWHPSGLSVTKADLWAFVFGKHPGAWVVSTDWLRRAVAEACKDKRNHMSCDYGQNPTKGWVVYLNHFLLTRDRTVDEH